MSRLYYPGVTLVYISSTQLRVCVYTDWRTFITCNTVDRNITAPEELKSVYKAQLRRRI